MRRKYEEEESINHERWLVSYADFITLLLAFFVVMYSMSQINESKFRVLSNTLNDAFNFVEYEIDPLEIGEVAKSNPLNLIPVSDGADVDRLAEGQGAQEQGMVPAELERINDELVNIFGNEISEDLLMIRGNEDWLEIELKSSLLFGSGGASLNYQAEAIINDIAGVIFDGNYAVRVEGHTDNQAIGVSNFASNWELSGARASAIVRQLVSFGIEPYRLSAIAYGEHQPIAANDSAAGRAQNRRVVLAIARHMRLRPSAFMADSAKPSPESGEDLPLSVEQEARQQNPSRGPEVKGWEVTTPEFTPQNPDVKAISLPDGRLLFTGPDRQVTAPEPQTPAN